MIAHEDLRQGLEHTLEILDMVAVNYRDLRNLDGTTKGLLYEWHERGLATLRAYLAEAGYELPGYLPRDLVKR